MSFLSDFLLKPRTKPVYLHTCTSTCAYAYMHMYQVGICVNSLTGGLCDASGICVEALCSPTSIQPLETVNLCLHAIFTLLDEPWPRAKIGHDRSLAIELLNVLHRLLLTRESTECFRLIMDVVRQVIKAAQENIEAERQKQKG